MKYSDNIDYLVSSIMYLGTHDFYWARTPSNLSSELSLDKDQLTKVFDAFPSIFRASKKPSSTGERFYSLQARYAQREGGDTDEPEQISYIAPLSNEKLNLLLDFVLKITELEKTDARSRLTNWIAVTAAVVSALTAIFVALHKN